MKRREFIKSAGLLIGGGVLGGGSLPVWAKGKKVRLKFDSYVSETAGPSWVDRWYLDELVKRTNGEIDVRRFWSASLNKVGEHLAAVRDKTSEMSLISPGYYQAELPVTRGLEWYYKMQRADALQQVCRDVYEQYPPLQDEWEKRHRSKVVYWTTWNYAPMITRTPIRSLEDFKGKRIRGYGVATDVIEKLGATAVPMAAPEVYTALERGVLDGVYGFDFITAVAYKLHEIAPHFTDIGDGPHAPAATIMNIDVWNDLPEPVRQASDEIVAELYGGRYAEIMDQSQREYVKKALQEGVQFHILNQADKDAARQLIQPAQVDAWINKVADPAGVDGASMQKLVDAAIARHDPQGKLLRPEEIAQTL